MRRQTNLDYTVLLILTHCMLAQNVRVCPWKTFEDIVS